MRGERAPRTLIKESAMFRVYGKSVSGNCHKVRMALEALALPYEWPEIDSVHGQPRPPEFLAKNPNGKVPLLEIEPGVFLPESNAILCYLADDTPLLPRDRLQRARVLQWLFFEQYSHEPYIAVARYLRRFHPDPASQRALAESKSDGGDRALAVMEDQLANEPFLAERRYTIAHLALYGFTPLARERGFDLARFPALTAWLARVEAQPRYVRMPSE